MRSTRISVVERQELKMESKKVDNHQQDSLVDMFAKGATNVAKAFENATRKRHADRPLSTPITPSSPALPTIPSARNERETRTFTIMPSVQTLLHPSVRGMKKYVGDGQTNHELIPGMIQSWNLEESSVGGDSARPRALLVADIIRSQKIASHKANGSQNTQEGIVVPKSSMEAKILKSESRHHNMTQKAQLKPHTPCKMQPYHTDTMNMNHQPQSPTPAARSPQKSYSSYSPMMGQQGSLMSDGSYSSRPKSRAIAIKRTRRCAEELAASQNEESNEKMYDWATWRMYNRIVDHRRNQNFGVPGPLPVSTSHLKRNSDQDDSTDDSTTQLSDRRLDGEIFELEI